MRILIVSLVALLIAGCDDDPNFLYGGSIAKVAHITVVQDFTMDSIDFRDLKESYMLEIAVPFTDTVEKLSGKNYSAKDVEAVNLVKCYLTLKNTTGEDNYWNLGFLDFVEVFVEGMENAESTTADLTSSNKLYFSKGGKTTFINALEDNISSCAISVSRSETNPLYLPMTATFELLLEFVVYAGEREL